MSLLSLSDCQGSTSYSVPSTLSASPNDSLSQQRCSVPPQCARNCCGQSPPKCPPPSPRMSEGITILDKWDLAYVIKLEDLELQSKKLRSHNLRVAYTASCDNYNVSEIAKRPPGGGGGR